MPCSHIPRWSKVSARSCRMCHLPWSDESGEIRLRAESTPVITWRTAMRAIVLEKFGGLDSLVYKEIPDPEPRAGHVVIEIKAFGLNHAEMHMRRGEWAEAANVIGIECVGPVQSCPGGEFPIGAKVAALMGGLGRTINGSYAEYTRVRASNVALIESDLPWAELAAIPETYATAWTCLFRNLEIVRGRTLVIRGAASSFGQAALNMAVDAGVRVIATARGRDRVALLEQLGAERVETEGAGPLAPNC